MPVVVKTSPMADVVHSEPIRAADHQPMANERARKGAGAALASMLIDETMSQAGKLKLYVSSLAELDVDGRKGFKDYLTSVMKERKAIVKENGTTVYKTINSSANVRLSEFRKIAEAMDLGFEADMTQSYHAIVGFARQHVADNGKKDGRGRKSTHALVKALKYLEGMFGDDATKSKFIDDADRDAITALYNQAAELAISLGLAIDKGDE